MFFARQSSTIADVFIPLQPALDSFAVLIRTRGPLATIYSQPTHTENYNMLIITYLHTYYLQVLRTLACRCGKPTNYQATFGSDLLLLPVRLISDA